MFSSGVVRRTGTLLGDEGDALALRWLRAVQLRQHLVGAREATGALTTGAAYLCNAQFKAASTGVVVVVDVVAVQAQAGFQAQRVARAKADG